MALCLLFVPSCTIEWHALTQTQHGLLHDPRCLASRMGAAHGVWHRPGRGQQRGVQLRDRSDLRRANPTRRLRLLRLQGRSGIHGQRRSLPMHCAQLPCACSFHLRQR
jgi:hypothetical protein